MHRGLLRNRRELARSNTNGRGCLRPTISAQCVHLTLPRCAVREKYEIAPLILTVKKKTFVDRFIATVDIVKLRYFLKKVHGMFGTARQSVVEYTIQPFNSARGQIVACFLRAN